MSTRWRRATWVSAALAAALLAGYLGVNTRTAHANSLGGTTSQTLFGTRLGISAITDKFDETNGISLNGTTDTNGDSWYVYPGTIRITSTGSAPNIVGSVKSATSPSQATVAAPTTSVNFTVAADVHTTVSTSLVGLLLQAVGSGTDRTATFVQYNDSGNGSLTLYRLAANGSTTTWTSKNNVGTGTNRYLLVTYLNGTYTVQLDGTTYITYSISGATRTSAEANRRFGIAFWTGDTTSTIDNFQGYAL